MNYEVGRLHGLLLSARRRRRALIVLRGAAVCVGVLACVLLATGWGAHRYRGSEGALLALRVGALVAFLAAVYLALVRPLARRVGDVRLARFIEERARGTEERLVTAVEFGEGEGSGRVSRALLERLRSDADGAAAGVDLDRVYSRRALAAYGAAALLSLLLFAGVLKWGPRGVSEGVAQLVAPSGMAAEANARAVNVKPGTARVPKGSDQEIKAALAGFDAEAASLFTRAAGAGEDAWQGQAMEQAKARGEFQLSLLNVQEAVEYFVESDGVRSEVFKLEVVDLPFVKQLDLVLNFPAFSRLPAKTVEDGGDVAALKGTVVTVTARLSGRARAARIVFADGRKVEMKAAGQDFVGALTVAGDTSYFVELTSVDGETYRGSNEFDVTALEDLPPTVSFERPGRDTKATNLEEVFTQAHAEDDFGVASIELFFSVNGGGEQRVNLQELSRDAARSLTGTHTFFLEEYKLKPGDFISYYAKARDASSETTSDIYFIEVKPFEMQYRQSQQQGGGGGQGEGGDQDQNALSRRQKELIAATHKLMREGQRYTPQERADGYEAVAAGQEKLKGDTLEFVERLRRRMGEQMEGREELSRMAEDLRAAAREMEGAPPPLRNQSGRDALPPEQRALQRLLAADAIFREMQVAFGNQQSGGGGGGRESRELADLMELELDKMKNQYETLSREQRQRSEQAKSEAERRLEELARRQERALEEQRRRQQGQQGQPRNSGGGGGSERQQQEMVEEARRAARELERLSRERRDARVQELSRQLDQAADDLQRAQSSSRSNQNDSIAQGERALERMRQAQRRLQQMRGGGASGQQGQRQEIGELRRRAAEAAARQRELTREAEQLARRGGQQQGQQQGQQGDESGRAARGRLAEREEALADSVNNLEEDVRQTARALGEGRQQAAARRLNEAADALRRNRVAERMREGARGAEQGRPESAREAGRAAERGLGEMAERLQEAEAAAGRPSGNGAEEALDRTRQLADDLDSLRRRLEERAARREGRGQQSQRGQQQAQNGGRQNGQQQGGQQQGGQQGRQQSQSGRQSQGGQQQGQQGSRSQQQGQQSAQQSGGGGGLVSGTGEDDARQLGSELRERLREAESLRQQLGGNSGGRELGGAIEQLRGLADGIMEGEAQTAASLKAQVIDPLRQLELELSKRLREQLGRTNLRLGDEGAAPGRYRRSVEEYYRRLSQGGRR